MIYYEQMKGKKSRNEYESPMTDVVEIFIERGYGASGGGLPDGGSDSDLENGEKVPGEW